MTDDIFWYKNETDFPVKLSFDRDGAPLVTLMTGDEVTITCEPGETKFECDIVRVRD